MAEGRIGRLDADAARAVAAEHDLPEYMGNLSVFQIALKNPRVARALNGMLHNLLIMGEFDGRLRELIIMRIGWATGATYEWTQHWRVATGMSIPESDLLGVRDWQHHAGFGQTERAVLAATDDSLATGRVSDESWAECSKAFDDEAALIELVAIIANWTLFSNLLRSLDVPLEDGTAPWPPDGQAP
ncbi:MAG: carboxymuconolactone decarboxylase family protein [bacterium]|nr:carboxymuconolactone decarboxylase family protein [bacterium]MCP4223179.1 carboxymuconolactone decarboxylase family protein [Actinomycetes bacterium]MCP5031812.1 carboxymuconolactone decarboxylase family protein [Actinomycetes bacterium]